MIVGDGPEESKLKRLVDKLNISDKVVFNGQVEYRDLAKYYSQADIFVRASLSEGQGIAFLEAMASGVPVIGTPVGGIPDFLEDGRTGLFCEVSNPESIAQKINEILKDDNLRKNIIHNGLELVREKYSWDKISLKMEEVFNRL